MRVGVSSDAERRVVVPPRPPRTGAVVGRGVPMLPGEADACRLCSWLEMMWRARGICGRLCRSVATLDVVRVVAAARGVPLWPWEAAASTRSNSAESASSDSRSKPAPAGSAPSDEFFVISILDASRSISCRVRRGMDGETVLRARLPDGVFGRSTASPSSTMGAADGGF
jgi:hypothetical protein